LALPDAGFSDFGAYGGEIDTPKIDQIAKSGAPAQDQRLTAAPAVNPTHRKSIGLSYPVG
jgi:hypothetical protein